MSFQLVSLLTENSLTVKAALHCWEPCKGGYLLLHQNTANLTDKANKRAIGKVAMGVCSGRVKGEANTLIPLPG